MQDDPSSSDKRPERSQPPVPLAFAAFAASVIGFMIVVVGLFALVRFIGRVR
jgi:large-conductance mechanosensitive channel